MTVQLMGLGVALIAIVVGSWTPVAAAVQQLLGPAQVNALPSKPADARIAYGPAPEQFGDLRLPAGRGPFPLAIVIHGGCFLSKIATLQNSAAMADALRDAGLATWNIEYRRIGDAGGGWPGTFQDVGLAADHVRSLAGKFPIATDRVIAVGHSAGAVLAIWLGAREKVPNGSPLHVRDPLRMRAVVGMGADGDLPPIAPALENLCGSKAADVFLEKPASPARLAQANPADMLPFGVPQLLISGTLDPFEPAAQKAAYMARIRKAGDKVDELTFDKAGHFEVVAPTSAVWPAVRDAILRVAGIAVK
jgi:acetyl esterase/lipase